MTLTFRLRPDLFAGLALLASLGCANAQSASPRIQTRPADDNGAYAANTAYVDAAVQVLLNGLKPVARSGAYADLTGRPTLGALAAKDAAAISDVTGLATALGGKAASGANGDITALGGLTTPLSVSQGGTGAATSSAARSSLAVAASGANADITALSGLTTPLSLSQGGTGSASASAARSSLGLGGAAMLGVGITAGTVAAGDDARITGAWQAPSAATTYTPTVTAASGTLTTVSATGRYLRIGPRLLFFQVDVTLTTNGTGAGSLNVSLPATSNAGNLYMLVGRETASTGSLLQGFVYNNATALSITNYDGSYPGANGRRLILSGVYETN